MRAREKHLTDAPSLRWVPIKGLKRAYELHADRAMAGRIRWTKLLGSLAEAEYDGQQWTFKRRGFLRPRVTARNPTSDAELAVLELTWGGSGILAVHGGARFRWQRLGFWGRRFAFAGESGLELISFEPKFGFVRRSGAVRTHAKAAKLPEFGLLVTLGWYVLMLLADDEAAINAAG